MKKRIVAMITIMMMVFSTTATFAATNVPSDVKGTVYEKAVTALIEKGIVNGYEDGTYKPNQEVTRAEACKLIVLMMGKGNAISTTSTKFTDVKGSWAEQFILTAADLGVIKGTTDTTFSPENNVTAQELATMVVRALGEDKNLKIWPQDYITKAQQLGLLNGISSMSQAQWSEKANRGLTAQFVYVGYTKLNKTEKPVDPGTTQDKAGKLKDYSGRAYGLILDVAKITDKDGDRVDEIKFLMGGETLYVNTDGKASIPSDYLDGIVYGLKMQNGVIKTIGTAGSTGTNNIIGSKNFVEYTKGDFQEVATRDSREITFTTAGGISIPDMQIMKDAILYEAVFSGKNIDKYQKVSLSSIEPGAYIRAYDVTDDNTDNADIVVIVSKSNAGKL